MTFSGNDVWELALLQVDLLCNEARFNEVLLYLILYLFIEASMEWDRLRQARMVDTLSSSLTRFPTLWWVIIMPA